MVFESWLGQDILLFSKSPTLALRPTKLPIQSVPGILPEGKAAEAWRYHSSPSGIEVKNEWSYISIPPTCLHGVDRENFTPCTYKELPCTVRCS
jgi:hypothetical protein